MGLRPSEGAVGRNGANSSLLDDEERLSPEQLAVNSIKNTLGKYNDKNMNEIVSTYDQMQEMLT